jgi:hypothetical protein
MEDHLPGLLTGIQRQSKNLTLDDIFATGYHDKLNAVAEKIFRKMKS